MNNTEKAYNSIFKLIEKHKDLVNIDLEQLKEKAKLHLFGLKLRNEYGLDIKPEKINNTNWFEIDNFRRIAYFAQGDGKTISWSDDGRQPENELLLILTFCTGAYIFGSDYPKEIFEKFFIELKSYNPKYLDSANKKLYFSMDNAANIFNSFDDILKKYQDLNKVDFKQREIKRLQEQIDKLNN